MDKKTCINLTIMSALTREVSDKLRGKSNKDRDPTRKMISADQTFSYSYINQAIAMIDYSYKKLKGDILVAVQSVTLDHMHKQLVRLPLWLHEEEDGSECKRHEIHVHRTVHACPLWIISTFCQC